MPLARPASCSAPTSTACENAVVVGLNSAHAALGLRPYTLPGDFTSLAPAQQLFILANIDRVAYGLPTISGLSPALDAAAALGVTNDADPNPQSALPSGLGSYGWSSNWAGAFANAPFAYYEWMYDDGLGSPNIDCQTPQSSGCWGHRQDVLAFANAGAVVMGAAAGVDRHGQAGYAMTLVGTQSANTSWTTLNYTWTQALADINAAAGSSGGGTPPASGSGTPPASGSGTPPASGSGTPPASGGGSTPAAGGSSTTIVTHRAASPASTTTAAPSAASSPAAPGPGPAPTAVLAPIATIAHANLRWRSDKVRFVLRASGPESGFQCALVRHVRAGAPKPRPRYAACGKVMVYSHLAAGRYTFYARAVGAGDTKPRPAARRSFSIR